MYREQMRVYDLHDSEGRIFAFEINNFLRTRQLVWRIASTIAGTRLVRGPKFLSWFREDVFCEFELDGVTFIACEPPIGDSSGYWIGNEPVGRTPQIDRVRESFARWPKPESADGAI